MTIQEQIKASHPPPEVPERPPEEDAFLFSVNYDRWIECYLTKQIRDQ